MSVPKSLNKSDMLNNYIDEAAPVFYNMGKGVMGSYDNIRFKTPCKNNWRHPPCVNKLKGKNMWVPQGTPLPLRNEMIYSELPNPSMFYFAQNYSSPACCPSTYSTDSGCVCTTAQQQNMIGQYRGNNKNYRNYSF